MSAITLLNSLPAELVVLSSDTIDRIDELTERALSIAIADTESLQAAGAAHAELHALEKLIEAERKKLKAPILDLGAQLDIAAKQALIPLGSAKAAVGDRIFAYESEQRRLYAEAQRKAEHERQRQQAEEDAKAEAARAAAAAQATPAGEDPLPDAEPPSPVEHIPQRVATAYVPPPAASGAIKMRTDYDLIVDDLAQVPAYIAGIEIRVLDEALAKKLIRGGAKIPGLRVVSKQVAVAKGARA